MLPREAPRAARTPISRVRSTTLPARRRTCDGCERQRRKAEGLEEDQDKAPLRVQ